MPKGIPRQVSDHMRRLQRKGAAAIKGTEAASERGRKAIITRWALWYADRPRKKSDNPEIQDLAEHYIKHPEDRPDRNRPE